MLHQDFGNCLPSQLNEDEVDSCMLAAEKAIASFEVRASAMFKSYAERTTVGVQLPNEIIPEQSYWEEEEEEEQGKLPYLALEIAFEEARYHLARVKHELNYLENTYREAKNLVLAAKLIVKCKDKDEIDKRLIWYRENKVDPAQRSYDEARKAYLPAYLPAFFPVYLQAFISRQISRLRLNSFANTIREIFKRFIIKPIKNSWERIKFFNKPVFDLPEVYYNGVAVSIKKEQESDSEDQARLKREEVFINLSSPLEKMQSGLESQKETPEKVSEIEISASSIRYRCR